jgi:hypothetical protein
MTLVTLIHFQTISGAFSSILQELNVTEVPYAECKEKPLFKNISPDKHLCAGGEEGTVEAA